MYPNQGCGSVHALTNKYEKHIFMKSIWKMNKPEIECRRSDDLVAPLKC